MFSSAAIVFAGLRGHKLRTFVTAVSVAVSVGTLVVSATAVRRIDEARRASDKIPRVEIVSPVLRRPLPFAYTTRIASLPKVKDVHWIRSTVGSIENGPDYNCWGASPTQPEHLQAMIDVPHDQLEAWKNDRQGILMTPTLLTAMGKKLGDQVQMHTYVGEISGKIDGVIGGYYGSGILAIPHWEQLSQVEGKPVATTIAAIVEDAADQPMVMNEIEGAFTGSAEPVIAVPQNIFLAAAIFQAESLVPRLLMLISLLMVSVTTVVTATTMATSLRERRADFGVLRSLGFRRSQIVRLVLLETSVVCIGGGIVAAVLCVGYSNLRGINMGELVLNEMRVSPTLGALGIAFSLLIAILAGAWPAFRTSRIDVVKALGKA